MQVGSWQPLCTATRAVLSSLKMHHIGVAASKCCWRTRWNFPYFHDCPIVISIPIRCDSHLCASSKPLYIIGRLSYASDGCTSKILDLEWVSSSRTKCATDVVARVELLSAPNFIYILPGQWDLVSFLTLRKSLDLESLSANLAVGCLKCWRVYPFWSLNLHRHLLKANPKRIHTVWTQLASHHETMHLQVST